MIVLCESLKAMAKNGEKLLALGAKFSRIQFCNLK
jgi:hypothetical protein